MSSTSDAEYEKSKTSNTTCTWKDAAPSKAQTQKESGKRSTRNDSRIKEDRKKHMLHSNLTDNRCCNYEGDEVQFVQIGMGTHTTFVQNFGGDPKDWSPIVAWLIEIMSETRPNHVRGVCAEPVHEIVKKTGAYHEKPAICLLTQGSHWRIRQTK